MTTGERVKILRKNLNLTLEKFGEKIGLRKSAVSRIENDTNNLTDQTVISICREFNVNEDWLRNGNGEMFKQTSDDLIEQLCDKYHFGTIQKKILTKFAALPDEQKTAVENFMKKIIEETSEENEFTALSAEQLRAEIDEAEKEQEKRIAAYEKKLASQSYQNESPINTDPNGATAG